MNVINVKKILESSKHLTCFDAIKYKYLIKVINGDIYPIIPAIPTNKNTSCLVETDDGYLNVIPMTGENSA